MSSEKRAQAEPVRKAAARRRRRPAIPGLGEFDSGRTDASQKAEQILRRAADRSGFLRSPVAKVPMFFIRIEGMRGL
jgi:hypothetical protein